MERVDGYRPERAGLLRPGPRGGVIPTKPESGE
jgi:hypothetical protein